MKEILFKDDASKKILKGVNTVCSAVVTTLGPRGQNVIFEESSYPTITKDGVTVAQQIQLEDKFENLGVMVAREAAENTNREAGDGTTSTMALLNAIYTDGYKYVTAGMNSVLLKKGMDGALVDILKSLEEQAKPVEDFNTKLQVATISANNDNELGQLIAEVIEKVGMDGVITVQGSNNLQTEVEYIKGTKINAGYESHVFINDSKKLSANFEKPAIIITTDGITLQSQLVPVIQKVIQAGQKNMVLFANRIEGQALAFLAQNHLLGKFTCVPIRVPSFGDYQRDLLYDLGALTQSTVLGVEDAKRIEDATFDDCGTCENIIINRYDTIVAGGEGDISKRVEEARALMEGEKDPFRIDRLKTRLGRLVGEIANIRVGGASETEQTEIKYRVEDAINATKSAIEEGIVEGGGMAILRAQPKLFTEEDCSKEYIAGYEIVARAVEAPLKTLVNNGGGNGEAIVGKAKEATIGYNVLTETWEDLILGGIIDPKKVVRCAITNAVATAGILLTSGVAIVRKVEK